MEAYKKRMSKGISNFQIENAIEIINKEDLIDNFEGVFSSIHLNKFINHAAMIFEKRANVPSLLPTLTAVTKEVHTGGAHLI